MDPTNPPAPAPPTDGGDDGSVPPGDPRCIDQPTCCDAGVFDATRDGCSETPAEPDARCADRADCCPDGVNFDASIEGCGETQEPPTADARCEAAPQCCPDGLTFDASLEGCTAAGEGDGTTPTEPAEPVTTPPEEDTPAGDDGTTDVSRTGVVEAG